MYPPSSENAYLGVSGISSVDTPLFSSGDTPKGAPQGDIKWLRFYLITKSSTCQRFFGNVVKKDGKGVSYA